MRYDFPRNRIEAFAWMLSRDARERNLSMHRIVVRQFDSENDNNFREIYDQLLDHVRKTIEHSPSDVEYMHYNHVVIVFVYDIFWLTISQRNKIYPQLEQHCKEWHETS